MTGHDRRGGGRQTRIVDAGQISLVLVAWLTLLCAVTAGVARLGTAGVAHVHVAAVADAAARAAARQAAVNADPRAVHAAGAAVAVANGAELVGEPALDPAAATVTVVVRLPWQPGITARACVRAVDGDDDD